MRLPIDDEGLVRLDYATWREASSPSVFTYQGGLNGSAFMAYLIGAERVCAQSLLPPPSVQSRVVVAMYAARDGFVCHLCGGEVVTDARHPQYASLRPSPDHLTPCAHGGSDYPSNILTAHLACNKARRDRPLTESLTYSSVSDSVSPHVGTHDRKGREGKGIGRGREVGHPSIRLTDRARAEWMDE